MNANQQWKQAAMIGGAMMGAIGGLAVLGTWWLQTFFG